MSRYNERKGRYGNDNVSINEGTCARTRPFSFEEILLRRKAKKLSEDVKEETKKLRSSIVAKDVVDEESRPVRYDRGDIKNPPDHDSKRKMETSNYVDEDCSLKSKQKVNHVETKLEGDLTRKFERVDVRKENRGRRKHDDRSANISEIEHEGKYSRNLKNKERNGLSSREKSEKESKRKDRSGNERSSDVENVIDRKHLKILEGHEKYGGSSSSGKYGGESKRKHGNEDRDKHNDRSSLREHDVRKLQGFESEKKEIRDQPKMHHEAERTKRRRSRSQEHKCRGDQRSLSPSSRTYKRPPHHGRDHEDLLSHSSVDRSVGKRGEAVGTTKMSTNGSNSHYRGHSGSKSRLGGYSPRKRRTEAAVKTPSPPSRVPDKKSAGWDLAPCETDNLTAGSVLQQNIHSVKLPDTKSSATDPVDLSSGKHSLESLSSSLPTSNSSPTDPVQLTQSTRPMRRLYIESVPASASEKAIMECLNTFVLSSDANRVNESLPCISCTIHKEKGQALVEFLTPEDASAAMSFDGSLFSGSVLKIRRPKDYAKMAVRLASGLIFFYAAPSDIDLDLAGFQSVPIFMQTGVLKDSATAAEAISNTLHDSPYKIFIGGISKVLSSKMFMEIASAFGPLKAYRFQFDKDLGKQCAFLEYMDQSITLKACLGLNGMKLGGEVITAVQAIPNASSSGNDGTTSSYEIPEHAKSLLEKPTRVLMLKNVFHQESLQSLSEQDIEEALEDIRLECVRFGTVKSINITKYSNSSSSDSKLCLPKDCMGSKNDGEGLTHGENIRELENSKEILDGTTEGISGSEVPTKGGNVTEADDIAAKNSAISHTPSDTKEIQLQGVGHIDGKDGSLQMEASEQDQINIPADTSDKILYSKQHNPDQVNCVKEEAEVKTDMSIPNSDDRELCNSHYTEEESTALSGGVNDKSLEVVVRRDKKENIIESEDLLEQGCVLVEFARAEAACSAAHNLHGRLFDDRIVSVRYISHGFYRKKFTK